jgi:2-polyprenyl-3-methyl-5-hydroxy-6-metoxy-1,4-benzoquinol methylase
MSKNIKIQTQEQINAFFKNTVQYWRDIYDKEDAQPLMYIHRQDTTVQWIEELTPDSAFRVLDIGCGAGMLSIELARRGLQVEGIDPVPEMIDLARRTSEEKGVAKQPSFSVGNIYAIDAPDASYDVVVALGVFVYLDRPKDALREMRRVTKPGGYIIFSTENQYALMGWLDPLRNPLLRACWVPILTALRKRGITIRNPWPDKMASKGTPWLEMQPGDPHLTDRLIAFSGLRKCKGITMSFYPIMFMGHPLLPKSLGIWLGECLDRMSRQKIPLIRSLGEIYLVMAKKEVVD